MTRIFVPCDTAARSVGADEVAKAVSDEVQRRRLDVEIVRNGSRGLLFLEPMVEFESPFESSSRRVAYGPLTTSAVPRVIGEIAASVSGSIAAGEPRDQLYLGPTEEIGWLARQQRLAFARVGVTDPLSPDDYENHGGLRGLRRALDLDPAEIVAEISESGLRGRGGAGFPTGIKWRTVLEAQSEEKFICCNADEGDSGTFADRMLMEGDPFLVIEGIVIAGLAVGASEGYIYIRSEYPAAVASMRTAIGIAQLRGWLGEGICGSERSFRLFARVGAGAYICGEETSMLESIEGNRGVARAKPPLPAISGLFGKPTVVNNVLTLAAVPGIVADGLAAGAYASLGTGRSRGTQVFQLGGNIARGGIVEVPFGITLRELVEGYGGGTFSGRPIRALQVGGPLGAYVPATMLDLATDYEVLKDAGVMLGHGGIVVFDDTVDMAAQARFAMEFCAEESCGKCTPCRIGSIRGVEVIDGMLACDPGERDAYVGLLQDLCEVMVDGSLCAMGGLTPQPVLSALKYFPDDFHPRTEADPPSGRGGGTIAETRRGDVR